MSPLCESFLAADQLEPDGAASIPLHVWVCERCFLVQLAGVRRAGRDLHRVRLLLVLLRHLGRSTPGATPRWRSQRLRPRTRSLASSRSPATTATCCSTSSQRGVPVLGIEPAANVAAGRRGEGRADPWSRFFGARAGRRSSWPTGATADLIVGNNVLAQVPDLNDFVAGTADPARARTASITMEFPHLLRLIDGEPVRHHLPRALLLLLASRRSEAIFAAHGLRALRRRGASRRTAARCASTPATPTTTPARRRRGRASCWRRESAAGLRPTRALRVVRAPRSRRPSARCSTFLIEAKRAGQDGRRLRRPRQGQHAAQLLRHPHRLPRLHRRPQPVQAGPVPAGHPHPDPRARADRARRRPDYVLILPWNLKDEIIEQMAYVREWGGRFVVPDPRALDSSVRDADDLPPTPLAGPSWSSPSASPTSAASSPAPSCRGEFDGARPEPERRAVQRLVQPEQGHAARHALPARRRSREAKLVRCTRGAVHDVIVDLRPRLADATSATSASCSTPRTAPDALRPGGLRARLPDPDRRRRGLLPDVGPLQPGARVGRALERSGVRHRTGPDRSSWSPSATAPTRTSGRDERTPRVAGADGRRRPRRARASRCTSSSRSSIPICRSITGDGLRRDARGSCSGWSRCDSRGADRHGRARLDGAAGVEHPRRLGRGRAAASGSSTSGSPTSTSSTTAFPSARASDSAELRPAPAHAARPARLDPVPDVLLRRRTGASASPTASSSALPEGEYEVVIDATLADGSLTYGECLLPGRATGGDPDLGPCLPSVARQRQPLGARAARRPGAASWPGSRAALHLPLPLRPRDDRLDHLAGPQRSGRSPGSAHGLVLPASATPGRSPTRGAGAATPRSTAPPPTC